MVAFMRIRWVLWTYFLVVLTGSLNASQTGQHDDRCYIGVCVVSGVYAAQSDGGV